MGGQNSALLAESIRDWWSLAGVDALVGEEPAGWLVVPPANDAAAAKPKRPPENEPEPLPLPAALQRQEAPEALEPKGPVVFPGDWTEFQSWLATGVDVPGSQWDARRVLPVGEADAPQPPRPSWRHLG